jgi:hypothetical protein
MKNLFGTTVTQPHRAVSEIFPEITEANDAESNGIDEKPQ